MWRPFGMASETSQGRENEAGKVGRLQSQTATGLA